MILCNVVPCSMLCTQCAAWANLELLQFFPLPFQRWQLQLIHVVMMLSTKIIAMVTMMVRKIEKMVTIVIIAH